jgi:hypothetical protein
MSGHALGVRLGFLRLRTRTVAASVAVSALLVVVVSLLERVQQRSQAVDNALAGAVFGLCVPVLCYVCFEYALDKSPLGSAVSPLARHGHPRPTIATGLIAAAAAGSALLSAMLGVLAVVLTHQAGSPRLIADLAAVTWIGALTGAAYSGLFALGSRLRRGRLWLLIADWLLGSGTGLLALPWPRGHARNLLGFAPVLELGQASAALALLLLVAAGFVVATRAVAR